MASSTATRPTNCPNCGVKLPDFQISLCAYCAMPIGVAEDTSGVESPNAGRITRVQEHDAYAGAMTWDPPESPDFLRGNQRLWRARTLGTLGIVALLLGAWLNRSTGGAGLILNLWSILGLLSVGLAGWLWSTGRGLIAGAVEHPLLRRPAVITDRRSDTRLAGWSGDTTYYFTIEFEGGAVGEFSYPGRGSNEDPYVSNLPGVAYTRGPRLLAFKHVRV